MALGKHKSIPVRVLGGVGIDVQLFEVKIGENVRRREGASRMAGLGVEYAFNNSQANLRRSNLKVFAFLRVHGFYQSFPP